MAFSSIQECFAFQAGQTPGAVAVSSGSTRLTYRELDERANRLAHRLLDLGVRPETPVAVLMERSVDVVAAILAVVKTGAFFLPLHSAHPLERLQWIVDHAGGPVLLTDEAMRERGLPRSGPVVIVDADQEPSDEPTPDPGVESSPDQAAYLMYTSGSTGQPKGVVVTHRGVMDLALDLCWDSGRHERLLMVAPYSFGVSAYELWVPLLRGGQVVVAPSDLGVDALGRLIKEERITGVHLTAGLFRVVAEEAPECFAGVREVLTGGDVIVPTAVRRVLKACPDTVVRAMYGATELTAFATSMTLTALEETEARIPVGLPMDGVRVYILDDGLKPLPPGVTGEMYIAGERLARGYFGRPDLTAERFVADPIAGGGERMYRTGDLARWTPEGLIDLVGRADQQVKIRGFRVELEEVRAALATYPGLAHVEVVASKSTSGDKRIIAYLVPEADGIDVGALRDHAARTLPDYMAPTAFVVLDALPLTPNGKLDRKALPVPSAEDTSDYRAPRDAVEKTLCEIFADVLGVARVGVDDSFFDLDGQSLMAMRLVTRIRSVLDVELEIGDLFNAPTVAELGARIGDRRGTSTT